MSRGASPDTYGHDTPSYKGFHGHEEWHADLLGCCSEPSLCMWSLVSCLCYFEVAYYKTLFRFTMYLNSL